MKYYIYHTIFEYDSETGLVKGISAKSEKLGNLNEQEAKELAFSLLKAYPTSSVDIQTEVPEL